MIIFSCEMIPWLVVIFGLVTAGSLNITDQQTSESNHHDQVAILKQIRKLNDDGSYTFGYEAGDGSFKVETRDVLGNVKGTFGFIDANGEIKRVTYSSSNGTGFKATTISPLQERASVIQSIPLKSNHSLTTNQKKQNSMVFSTSTDSSPSISSLLLTTSTTTTPSSSSPKSNVIQSIPTRRSSIKTTPIPSSTAKNTEKFTRAIFGQYFRNFNNRSRQAGNDQQSKQSSTPSDERKVTNHHKNDPQKSQAFSSNGDVKADTEKDNFYGKISLEDILHPVKKLEDYNRRSEVNIGNNNFRRQIDEKPTIKVRESTEENSNENLDVYNGRLLSTTRPLFTTTTTISPSTGKPKVIQRHRPGSYRFHQVPKLEILPSNEKNLGPAKFYNAETEKLADESPEIVSNFNIHDSLSNEKDEVVDYMVKHPAHPVYSRHQYPEKNYKHLPLGIILTNIPSPTESQENNGEVLIGRRIPLRTRVPIKQVNHQHSDNKEDIEFLTNVNPVELPITATNPNHIVEQRSNEFITPHSEADVSSPINLQLVQQLYQHLQQQRNQYQQQQSMRGKDYLQNYFYRHVVFPSEHQTPIAPPLSRRDFQLILRRLLAHQYGMYAFDHPTAFLNDAFNEDDTNVYQNPTPHYSSMYDQHSTGNIPVIIPRKYSQRIAASESSISKVTNPLNLPFKQMSKSRYYDNSNLVDKSETINSNDDAILPPSIREALLLKLLQIAMDNKQQQMLYKIPVMTNSDTNILSALLSKVAAVPVYRKTGPVRSVQIISDNESDENDNDRNN